MFNDGVTLLQTTRYEFFLNLGEYKKITCACEELVCAN